MPTIEVGYDQRASVNAAWVEYTRKTGNIETMVEGPPVFSGGAVATGYTMIISQGFADFLKAHGVPFKLAA